MKYISEINAFYDLLEINTSLTHSSIALWHALMQTANKCGWRESFTVAISTLEGKTLLNRQAVIRARNQLQQGGFISFESRKGNLSAIYKINSLCDKLTYDFDTQSDTQSNTQSDTHGDTINRLDKTRLDKTNKKENIKGKSQYAQTVSLTADEYQRFSSLVDEGFTLACIDELNNYKLSSGKKYKSDYHTMLGWVREKVAKTYIPCAIGGTGENLQIKTAEEIKQLSDGELFGNG